MKPTEILSAEHRVIEQVLDCLEALNGVFNASDKSHRQALGQAIFFLKNFADRCHHGKEEAQLFPVLEAKGFSPDQGPTAVMRLEHIQGRGHIQAMESCLDKLNQDPQQEGVYRGLHQAAQDYIYLLRDHIQKEDHCLFPMADKALSKEEMEAVYRAFLRVESEDMPKGLHQECLSIADQLASQFQIPKRAEAGPQSCCGH